MYTLLVCADLYAEKHNIEITFYSMPTMAELQRKIIEVFNAEGNSRRPQGYPAMDFTVARIQIYDDVLLKWADLVSPTQLHEYDQLYVFQPQNPWHIDVQKDLPPPRPPIHASRAPSSTPYASPAPYTAQQQQPAPYTPPSSAASGQLTRSATSQRLDEQRRRAQAIQDELRRLQEETARLEREQAREEEEARQREAEQFERYLREKEREVQQQREILSRTEQEYHRLISERRAH